jgi:hypothetical protein
LNVVHFVVDSDSARAIPVLNGVQKRSLERVMIALFGTFVLIICLYILGLILWLCASVGFGAGWIALRALRPGFGRSRLGSAALWIAASALGVVAGGGLLVVINRVLGFFGDPWTHVHLTPNEVLVATSAPLQLLLALGGLASPALEQWRRSMRGLPPATRRLLWAGAVAVWIAVLVAAAASTLSPHVLADGGPMARHANRWIAVAWSACAGFLVHDVAVARVSTPARTRWIEAGAAALVLGVVALHGWLAVV